MGNFNKKLVKPTAKMTNPNFQPVQLLIRFLKTFFTLENLTDDW